VFDWFRGINESVLGAQDDPPVTHLFGVLPVYPERYPGVGIASRRRPEMRIFAPNLAAAARNNNKLHFAYPEPIVSLSSRNRGEAMSELCDWVHVQLDRLPLVKFPFKPEKLPNNGIYFFYEAGEAWGHGEPKPRIVRIGTHREGNFRSRIAEHFLLNDHAMEFDQDRPAPHDRSIFRKNIGRALLVQAGDDYLQVWNRCFTTTATRLAFGHLRDIDKEKRLEAEVTRIIRETFSFRYIPVEGEERRMGGQGLEKALIGTVARCQACRPSSEWLGGHSPVEKVRESGLWLSHHLKASPITGTDKRIIQEAISKSSA
jgi:hypothetical protein